VGKPAVARGERVWNEGGTGKNRENTGVYRLLRVNHRGIRQLRGKVVLRGCSA
jgi:hypothetical protein